MTRTADTAPRRAFRSMAVARMQEVGWDINGRGCFIWRGGTNGAQGYGYVVVGRRRVLAHRLMLELKLGRPIKPGMLAIHSCDTPLCIRPDHLREGTAEMNAQDRLARTGNHGATLTHCGRGHEYTPENTRYYRDPRGRSHRKCVTCRRERAQARAGRAVEVA